MRNNALIKAIRYYMPQNVVNNETIIKEYKGDKTKLEHLLQATGRNIRYIANEDETVTTMACEAVQKLLEETHTDPSLINMVIFSSSTPEYLSPTTAAKIHAKFKMNKQCRIYDLNANCAGMIVALEQAANTMRYNPNIKYAIIVGADQIHKYAKKNQGMPYGNFGDSACAVLLENVFDTDRGMIDSDYYVSTKKYNDNLVFPKAGLSNILLGKDTSKDGKLLEWNDMTFKPQFHSAHISIEKMLFRNGLETRDVKQYFISQFVYESIKNVAKELNDDFEKFKFIGDFLGYTGTTSPMLACCEAMKNKEVKPGDYVIFWTIGAGTICPGILWKM